MIILKAPDKNFHRYTEKPFPNYRFMAGENPHPTEHPQGHSYGKEFHQSEKLYPQRWYKNETYLYGVDLYNFAYWWEAHEAFESLWRESQPVSLTRDFLQGLIKVSAAFLKWHQRKERGLKYLFQEAMRHLKRVSKQKSLYMGLNLKKHISKLTDHFQGVFSDPPQWKDPLDNYPFIVLERTKKA